jgi:hypothetical protein
MQLLTVYVQLATIIEAGTQANQNLFHSFQKFSVDTGKVIHFNNALPFEEDTLAGLLHVNVLVKSKGKKITEGIVRYTAFLQSSDEYSNDRTENIPLSILKEQPAPKKRAPQPQPSNIFAEREKRTVPESSTSHYLTPDFVRWFEQNSGSPINPFTPFNEHPRFPGNQEPQQQFPPQFGQRPPAMPGFGGTDGLNPFYQTFQQ